VYIPSAEQMESRDNNDDLLLSNPVSYVEQPDVLVTDRSRQQASQHDHEEEVE
jgi:hypothetical protein